MNSDQASKAKFDTSKHLLDDQMTLEYDIFIVKSSVSIKKI